MAEYKTIHFKSKDGLRITADYYPVPHPIGMIVLCHRSHCNRAEYRETAPKLNRLGFSCLAIDQRSGMKVFGEINETSALAKRKGLPTGYLDARQDIEAAVDRAVELHHNRSIILWGSSYSASLALLIALNPGKICGVVAFSPGNFLTGVDLKDEIRSLNLPLFVTGAKKEIGEVRGVVGYVNPRIVSFFKPSVEGFHGSKTLWSSVRGHETYWAALERFLFKVSKIER